MPTRFDLMQVNYYRITHQPGGSSSLPPVAWAGVRAPADDWDELWDGPTLRELVDRVEHQFGQTPGLASVFTLGFGSDEPLTPGDIQAVCDHLGLPAEDFGLDP